MFAVTAVSAQCQACNENGQCCNCANGDDCTPALGANAPACICNSAVTQVFFISLSHPSFFSSKVRLMPCSTKLRMKILVGSRWTLVVSVAAFDWDSVVTMSIMMMNTHRGTAVQIVIILVIGVATVACILIPSLISTLRLILHDVSS